MGEGGLQSFDSAYSISIFRRLNGLRKDKRPYITGLCIDICHVWCLL
jgi:hypothetical protein